MDMATVREDFMLAATGGAALFVEGVFMHYFEDFVGQKVGDYFAKQTWSDGKKRAAYFGSRIAMTVVPGLLLTEGIRQMIKDDKYAKAWRYPMLAAIGIRAGIHLANWYRASQLPGVTLKNIVENLRAKWKPYGMPVSAPMSDYVTVPRMQDYLTTNTNVPQMGAYIARDMPRMQDYLTTDTNVPQMGNPALRDYIARNMPRMQDYVTVPQRNQRFGNPIQALRDAQGV